MLCHFVLVTLAKHMKDQTSALQLMTMPTDIEILSYFAAIILILSLWP